LGDVATRQLCLVVSGPWWPCQLAAVLVTVEVRYSQKALLPLGQVQVQMVGVGLVLLRAEDRAAGALMRLAQEVALSLWLLRLRLQPRAV
jgi:hypothetical protein